jgi:hypothetical protein
MQRHRRGKRFSEYVSAGIAPFCWTNPVRKEGVAYG